MTYRTRAGEYVCCIVRVPKYRRAPYDEPGKESGNSHAYGAVMDLLRRCLCSTQRHGTLLEFSGCVESLLLMIEIADSNGERMGNIENNDGSKCFKIVISIVMVALIVGLVICIGLLFLPFIKDIISISNYCEKERVCAIIVMGVISTIVIIGCFAVVVVCVHHAFELLRSMFLGEDLINEIRKEGNTTRDYIALVADEFERRPYRRRNVGKKRSGHGF